MARGNENYEAVTTISPDGAIGNRGNGRDGRQNQSRNDGNDNRPGDEAVGPAQGALVMERGHARVEGDREKIIPGVYYNQNILPALRGIIDHLTDPEQVAHYNDVVGELSSALNINEATKNAYEEFQAQLDSKGGEELADEIKSHYQDQLRKSLLVINGYVETTAGTQATPERLKQEKAVLVYAEFLLSRMQHQLLFDNNVPAESEFDLQASLGRLDIDEGQRDALTRAFLNMGSFGDFSYIQSCKRVTEHSDLYLAPDALVPGDRVLRLDSDAVHAHLERSNDQIEGVYRSVINALDRVNEPGRLAWIEQREQNPEIDLNRHPFSTWEAQIAEQNNITLQEGEHLPSKYYVNCLLGEEKSELGFLGSQRRHRVEHVIRTTNHKAPVKQEGGGKERLEDVQAVEISLRAGVYQGELRAGELLTRGESRPKEFFERVVDVTVWSTTLNSADAVENFADQLLEADALRMDGAEVVEVLGRYEGDNPEAVNAQAFRVPVMDRHGKPTFIVVNRETMLEMMRVAHVSRDSYARLARMDSRYIVHSREERWAAFRPQLRQHENTPESWVDQERDFILTAGIFGERITELRARGNEVDNFVADQLTQALESYRAQFNEFQMNYCNLSRYRSLATVRLEKIGIHQGAPDFARYLREEMNAVALEYMNRWNAFRNITGRVLAYSSENDLTPGEVEAMQMELTGFLANIDYELEVQARVNSAGVDERRLREVLRPFTRTTSPPRVDGKLLDSAYEKYRLDLYAGDSFPNEIVDGLYTSFLRRLLEEDSVLNQAATSGNIEAKIVLKKLRSLNVRNHRVERNQPPGSEVELFKRNAQILTEIFEGVSARTAGSGDLVYPQTQAVSAEARQAVNGQSAQLEEFLGRQPTDEERIRSFGREELNGQRIKIIEQIRDIGQAKEGLAKIDAPLLELLGDKDFSNLSRDETVDLSCVVYAYIKTITNLPEEASTDQIVETYNGYLDEAAGADLTVSDVIKERVHNKIDPLFLRRQP